MMNLQASSITSRLSLAVSYSLNRDSLPRVSMQYLSIRAQKFSSHLNKRCLNSCPSYRSLATMASDPSKYKLNHTMIRVKEPNRSIKFYEFLGMKLVRKYEQPEAKFDLYFMGFDSPKSLSHGKHFSDREGLLELTHNYGTEIDPDYAVSTGNVHPHKGFGHTCISVDNIQASCQRLEEAGYPFQKKLNDGSMKNIAFVLDPDGYWVEIIGQKDLDETKNIQETNLSSYRLNHTMIRVKDPARSLRFYQDVLGMKLISTLENKSANYNLYFLGYTGENASTNQALNENLTSLASREGLLELTWNFGTEADSDFKYHNGNVDPKGYGHICISVDNIENACQRLETMSVTWKKRLTDGRMKNIAFFLDPDNYWIEVIQNENLKDLMTT
ncbi:Lactoylglutathione lyase [Golovinomyces cichoracearum]|uniref:Lactoylglutathione lyase n=1 Tax=Golovinomyces cichoracearum TaxID=62708 RepID=A0A420H913_9PEZI|nr:Lactoylglutathione lyase [Golovinomyces cichoracearum]